MNHSGCCQSTVGAVAWCIGSGNGNNKFGGFNPECSTVNIVKTEHFPVAVDPIIFHIENIWLEVNQRAKSPVETREHHSRSTKIVGKAPVTHIAVPWSAGFINRNTYLRNDLDVIH
ncbi:hypothetical protein SDC9_96506 [bioreactor metagenome]|uniref:Uncharacterized protein n=1 Tax=bioreactor metagenome TaxID=1076179 RepID=A0A645A996_9ZZZZ